jgi:predicted TIM-barrel fold metal-dependent hydrolase
LVERIEEYSGFPGRGPVLIFTEVTRVSICPKNTSSAGQIYFGFEVDEKLLPFAIEESDDQCWVYGSDIPHGDRLYGAVDVFLKRDDISEESKRKLLVDNTARFYGLTK